MISHFPSPSLFTFFLILVRVTFFLQFGTSSKVQYFQVKEAGKLKKKSIMEDLSVKQLVYVNGTTRYRVSFASLPSLILLFFSRFYTHQFMPFSERLKAIDVDVLHKLDLDSNFDPKGNSYFAQNVEEAAFQSFTTSFNQFYNKMHKKTENLASILHHREEIIDSLLHYVSEPDSESTEVFLKYLPQNLFFSFHFLTLQKKSLLALLARDLRHYFYPYFNRVLLTVVEVIDPNRPKLLESVFSCLAYLFKFLQKHLVKDILSVFDVFRGLLSHKKEFIRHFASQSFAFVVRKLPAESMRDHLLYFITLPSEENFPLTLFRSGLSELLFEIVKSVKGRLHSTGAQNLLLLLSEKVICRKLKSNDLHNKEIFSSENIQVISNEELEQRYMEIIIPLFEKIASYIEEAEAPIIWNVIKNSLQNVLSSNEEPHKVLVHMSNSLEVILTCFSVRNSFYKGISTVTQEIKKRKRDEKKEDAERLGIEQMCFLLTDLLNYFASVVKNAENMCPDRCKELMSRFYELVAAILPHLPSQFLSLQSSQIHSLIFQPPLLFNPSVVDCKPLLVDFWKKNKTTLSSLSTSNVLLHKTMR